MAKRRDLKSMVERLYVARLRIKGMKLPRKMLLLMMIQV